MLVEIDQDRQRDSYTERHIDSCRVVVGPEETAAARLAWPDVAIVTLVEASEPDQAVYARTAGADVVLPTVDLASGWRSDTPGLAAAVSAAESLAERRLGVSRSSRRATHDLGQALSAINLAAELAIRASDGDGDGDDRTRLLHQIQELVHDAGAHAWSAGRGGRSVGTALGPVDLSALMHRIAKAEPDVAVYDSSRSAWVLGDVGLIEDLLEDLIQYGRRSATRQRIDVKVGSASRVEIALRGIASARSTAAKRDVEFGLDALSETANELGAKLHIDCAEPAPHEQSQPATGRPAIRLSFPLLPVNGPREGLVAVPPDRMAIQTHILEGVLRHAPLSESLEAIVAAIEQQLPGTRCSVLLLEEGRYLTHGAGASLPEAYREAIDGVTIGFGQGSCGTSAFLGKPVIVADVATDRLWVDFKDLALQHDLRSCWSTPILAADGGAVLGTFAVYRSEIWEPDDAATRLVSRFTYLAAVAIGHHRLFTAVAESESRFRGAFEGATSGMALVALDGSLLKVNPALCAMLDTEATVLCQSNVFDLVQETEHHKVSRDWAEILDAAGNGLRSDREPIELSIPGEVGHQPLWISMSSSLVSVDHDDQVYFYVEWRDISARRRHAVEQRAREAAEAASEAKTDFLALVSHELRTPLNAILGFAQLMKLVELDASQQADSIENILKAGQHLLELINELLDMSLVESGHMKLQIEDVNANEAVDEALQILGPLADMRGIDLHRAASAHLPHTKLGRVIDLTDQADTPDGAAAVVADRQCLRQVLINLVGNALKFAPAGGEVAVAVTRTADRTIRFRVVDSGPGIAAEDVEGLFQPFHRLATHPQAEGTGLGLSVAARLTEAMHGRVGVNSHLGTGSCFWVDLPAGSATTNATAGQAATSDPPAAPPLESAALQGRVLYVEDDPASVQVIASTLALRPKVSLATAATTAEGLAAIRAEPFDAILLDLGLPDGSGWDLLDTVRRDPAMASTPVVVLTAGSVIAPTGTPGPDRIMQKPLDIADCLETIDALLAPDRVAAAGPPIA